MTKYIFLHLHKTAGNTIGEFLKNAYGSKHFLEFELDNFFDDYIRLIPDINYKMIKGHFSYGIHKHINSQDDYKYFTVLRNPVNRVISNFFHIKKEKDHIFQPLIKKEGFILVDFLKNKVDFHFDNLMTRYLAGEEYVNLPIGSIDDKILDIAKLNLTRKEFILVGIQEHLDETLFILNKLIKLNPVFVLPSNINPEKNQESEVLNDEIIEVIKQTNPFDCQLYEFGKKLFKESRSKFILTIESLEKLPERTDLGLVTINNTPFQKFMTVKNSAFINIKGWAIDKKSNKVADSVYLYIDNKEFFTMYGIDALDIAEIYKNFNLRFSGFQTSIPGKDFEKGKHELFMRIVSNDKKYYYETDPVIFIIEDDNNKLDQSQNPILKNVKPIYDFLNKKLMVQRIYTETNYNFETLNGLNVENMMDNNLIFEISDEYIVINGWAFDYPNRKPCDGVFLSNADNDFVTIMHNREDVAKYYNDFDIVKCGFEAVIPIKYLDEDFPLFIKILNFDRTVYYKSYEIPFKKLFK
ncbi:MAG: hypothetical protein HW421_2773 [Ignavibacteria bacterium]|nr:hypothetical protein [Ignavibacteria bacterium]